MDSVDLSPLLSREFSVPPLVVPALLVPEAELVELVMAAREVSFGHGEGGEFRGLVDDLDKASEPFADMLDLPYSERSARREELTEAARHVRAWLDAGCITVPPVHYLRALVEALS